jgi:hypothetical protein
MRNVALCFDSFTRGILYIAASFLFLPRAPSIVMFGFSITALLVKDLVVVFDICF